MRRMPTPSQFGHLCCASSLHLPPCCWGWMRVVGRFTKNHADGSGRSRRQMCQCLVTLLVNDALPPPCDQDEHEARDNLWRKPQYLNHSLASLECFHDWRQSGPESCIPLTSNPGSSYGAGSPPELDLQSHPFRIAWLPGSRIYAAAALNHVWINDGHADRVLACWHQEDPELRPRIRLKCLNLLSSTSMEEDGWPAKALLGPRTGSNWPGSPRPVTWSCHSHQILTRPKLAIPQRLRHICAIVNCSEVCEGDLELP